jgi:hypothetical protein
VTRNVSFYSRVASTLALSVGVLCASVFGVVGLDLYQTHINYRTHSRLALGMRAEAVQHLAGRRPNCIVRLGRWQAWFYWSVIQSLDACPETVRHPSELPGGIQSLQILVGDDHVVAYGLEGEWPIVSARRPAEGSSLAGLPLSYYE